MLGRLISGLTLVMLAFSGAACSKKGMSSLSKVLVKPSGSGAKPTSSDLTPFSITHPIANPHTSSEGALTVQGTCRSGSMIRTSGAFSQTTGCAGGHFLFELNAAADGSFETRFEQNDSSGKVTGSATLIWKRDSSLPPTPIIQSPSSPAHTSSSQLVLDGTCIPGNRVELSGDQDTAVDCSSGTFSITVLKSSDGVYSFSVRQKNPLGILSGATDFLWFRDAQIPTPPTLDHPVQNPSVSRSASLTLSGTCEAGDVVSLRGAETAETSCLSGSYAFQVVRDLDGVFNFEIFQTDLAGNTSPSVQHTWKHDSTLPYSPKITSHSNPLLSNQNSIILRGECEPGALVMLTGSASLLSSCSGGFFQFDLAPGKDGTFSYSVSQSDSAGNASDEVLFVWTRDSQAPSAPQILAPSTSPHLSSSDSLDIKGSCETGAKVDLSGDGKDSLTCVAQAFSFNVKKTTDGSYSFAISQVDPAGNASTSVQVEWTRDSKVPAAPQVLMPTLQNPVTNQNSLVINGNCLTGANVELNGAATLSQTCTNGSFAFTVQKGMDGTYPFSLRQITQSGVPSPQADLTWTRDTVLPEVPVLDQPTGTEFISKADSLMISGTCETAAQVQVSGDASFSTPCTAGTFNFVVSKVVDGAYSFFIGQRDLAGNDSGLASVVWRRDATSPEALVIDTPSFNPFVSGNDEVLLSGSCEPTLKILISDGTDSSESMCSPTGTFQLVFQKTVDGSYSFKLLQKDLAENLSPITDFTWERDTTPPQTPTLVPADNPMMTNGNSIVISATCDQNINPDPAVIQISGDVAGSEILNPPAAPADPLTAVCANGNAQFEIKKTVDGAFRFYFTQMNPNTSFSSSSAEFVWIRDTQAPAKPILTSPPVQPFIAPGSLKVMGSCEPLTSVRILLGTTLLTTDYCDTNGQFSSLVNQATDGTYNLTVDQKDAAGNISAPVPIQWVRDSSAVPQPVILSPVKNPELNNQNQISIIGSCQSGYMVSISNAATGSILCVNNRFTFDVTATSDGTRNYSITQSINGVVSAPTAFQWIRDTLAPTVKLVAFPPSTQMDMISDFVVSSSESNVTFSYLVDQGSIASAATNSNTDTYRFLNASNGPHTFKVQVKDGANNVSPWVSYSWVQNSFNTLALYHFNKTSTLVDSSLFGKQVNQTLSNPSTTPASLSIDTSGVLPTSRKESLRISSTRFYSTPANEVINTLGRKRMTVEGFFRLSSSLSSGQYYTLVSKTGAASPDFGWEIRIRRSTNTKTTTYQLDFVGSETGTIAGAQASSSEITISTSTKNPTWYYFAVTWEEGVVSFFYNKTGSTSATQVGSGTIGAGKVALSSTVTAPLRIGFGPNSGTGNAKYLNGMVDEIRISQSVRKPTIPTIEFSPD